VYYTLSLCILLQKYNKNLEIKNVNEFIETLKMLNNKIYEVFQELKLKPDSKERKIKILQENLNFKEIRDLMFMIMLGANLSISCNQKGLLHIKGSVMYISEMEKFKSLLLQYGLEINEIFLDKELEDKRALSSLLKNNKQSLLKNLEMKRKKRFISNSNKVKRKNYTDRRRFFRNFLAHCGFHDDITFLGKNNKGIFIGYDHKYIGKIYDLVINL